MAITPYRVIRDQWKTLVNYWNTKRTQLQKKGTKIDRVNMFIETQPRIDKNKMKTIIDDEATHVISQFEEHLRDIPAEEQTDIIREQVFT
ncbi:hypothetical protein Ddye_011787 [Dipteronia dyeriana]|uniref:Uncharacterized protein n=1 Tax=Dipteronia dyeriana TaxID=168575 RepID=A0AAD9X351_9ROSI|nr:hypothetical protein Ddye_011787 [Dipteronia dyeriana]